MKFKQTISSQERTLEISEELAQLLSKKKSKQGYIFLTYYGEPFNKSKLGRAVTKQVLAIIERLQPFPFPPISSFDMQIR